MKLAVDMDVPHTRRHWYPKYLFFPSKYPYRWNDSTLAPRTTVGQAVCDFSIDSGAAIAVPKRHNTVADAMARLQTTKPDYYYFFLRVFASPESHPGGWEEFLGIVVERKMWIFLCRIGRQDAADACIQEVLLAWQEWYRHYRKCREVDCGPFGFEFEEAVAETEEMVETILIPLIVSGLEVQIQN